MFFAFAMAVFVQTAPIVYDVTFPGAVHHEAEIRITYTDLPTGPLELRMSRSSPGRYAIHEFAKNVYGVRAWDPSGRELEIVRPDPYQWNVIHHSGAAVIQSTLFADRGGGTYTQVDPTHAHLNMPATFMWARGLGDRPIKVTFTPPDGATWRAATQLFPTDRRMSFTAPNLQYFMDSPTELSDHSVREWSVGSGDQEQTMRLAIHHAGTEAEVDAYAEMVKKVVAEEIAVYGEAPRFDGGTYTFIADYLPWVSGDGMEHRNSTILASTGNLETSALRLLGTVSHEFFHAWNVERIRPKTLEPFDFERANMSRELWFAEGFTSYYTPLFIRRAGLIDDDEWARRISGGISYVVNAPGRTFFSAVEMSMQAPFVDAASSIDPVNRQNTFISYYTWGSVIGLNLDLTLRADFGRNLDGFMRHVWQRFGQTEEPYTVEDLERELGGYTGEPMFAAAFFDAYVRGREVPDYKTLLAQAGLLLQPASEGEAWMGNPQLGFEGVGIEILSGTTIGTPLYHAGLDRNDVMLSIDGSAITSREALTQWLQRQQPGDVVSVEYRSRGERQTTSMTLAENPRLEVVTYESAGRTLTSEMRAFRDDWLRNRAQ